MFMFWNRVVLFPVRRVSSMVNTKNDLYERAVFELNKLQSNAQTLSKWQDDKHAAGQKMIELHNYLQYIDLSLDVINGLNCIHVAGTKGKGSTCAFVESILQNLGFKTGFYSSPHLMHVCERIRLNGRPLSKEKFSNYFFKVFEAIQKKKTDEEQMPFYFKFLTLMAFKVFSDENVDVAIIEVGIGGENDCTNIIPCPVVGGISTLDFDHVNVLGKKLEEIAWHKAGIMKANSLLISSPQQPHAMRVIEERSVEKDCPMHVAPEISEYSWPNGMPKFGIAGDFQHTNASLALQLSRFWLLRTNKLKSRKIRDLEEKLNYEPGSPLDFKVPSSFVDGLEKCFWPGRTHIFKDRNIVFYLDSAHTPQSMKHCANWFSSLNGSDKNSLRILVFHCTADRDPNILLSPLTNIGFQIAVFCPTRLQNVVEKSADTTMITYSPTTELEKCKRNENIWCHMTNDCSKTSIFPCVEEALSFLDELAANNSNVELHVLVTGSLHLVGGVLHFKQPDLFEI